VALSLLSLAGELHSLAWLHAAFQGACLCTPAGGGMPASSNAHMPLHAEIAICLQGIVRALGPSALM
jgi:hypothetical protein